MSDPDPIGNDLRRERRARAVGDAACVICGEQDPAALRRAGRSLLERHHLGGEANDEELKVVLCLTHHRRLTFSLPGAGVDLERDPERSVLDRLVSVLRGLAFFFRLLAEGLVGWADRVSALISDLDANAMGWRAWASAQI